MDATRSVAAAGGGGGSGSGSGSGTGTGTGSSRATLSFTSSGLWCDRLSNASTRSIDAARTVAAI